MLNTVK